MMSQTGEQIITLHILSNISINKCKQTVSFWQLIEHKIFFLENHTQNKKKKLVPDTFIKT